MSSAQTKTVSFRIGGVGGVKAFLARLASTALSNVRFVAARIRGVAPERWFLLVFARLLLTFVLLLFVQPSGVGRGGR